MPGPSVPSQSLVAPWSRQRDRESPLGARSGLRGQVSRTDSGRRKGSREPRVTSPLWKARALSPCRTPVCPRVCGESSSSVASAWTRSGLSPRLRGIRKVESATAAEMRSIPAPAGNPSPLLRPASLKLVYPRACGESHVALIAGAEQLGLSPRLRGIPHHPRGGHSHAGSIPAPAGNPPPSHHTSKARRVYPRACGESSRLEMS